VFHSGDLVREREPGLLEYLGRTKDIRSRTCRRSKECCDMQEAPPYLSGNYAPVTDEVTAYELRTEGSIPRELTGWYIRNGPNPHDAASGHWFLGDGMVHGVRLEHGRATSYRNRWVRASTFLEGLAPGP
jgi:carotenoid cleavage dioxygenase-like enzyme